MKAVTKNFEAIYEYGKHENYITHLPIKNQLIIGSNIFYCYEILRLIMIQLENFALISSYLSLRTFEI